MTPQNDIRPDENTTKQHQKKILTYSEMFTTMAFTAEPTEGPWLALQDQ